LSRLGEPRQARASFLIVLIRGPRSAVHRVAISGGMVPAQVVNAAGSEMADE